MKGFHPLRFILMVAIGLSACTSTQVPPPATLPATLISPTVTPSEIATSQLSKIDRHPYPFQWPMSVLSSIPAYDPASVQGWQVDLRHKDVSQLDLRQSLPDLLYADFDTETQWPPLEKMPTQYEVATVLEMGKNPGLGVRQLQVQGITGRGIGIAIIDQTLLVDHQEYVNQLRLYEEASDIQGGWMSAQMHGAAVASIAVGKSVGVAPEADLYFFATSMCSTGTYDSIDFSCLANSVRKVLEINQQLPQERKIRVLSMSIGWSSQSKGYADITAAVAEAKAAGIFVISTSLEDTYGYKFHGLGRSPLADPDDFQSYEPGLWWAGEFYSGQRFNDRLLVPMDARTTAGFIGGDEYAFYRQGGWSWVCPYLAGMYALALQVKPNLTPDAFWSLALETGQTIQLERDGEQIPFGPILDPVALISALQARR